MKNKHLILTAILFSAVFYSAFCVSFGQNKVQYRKFDWQYLQSKHFDIYFLEEDKKLAEYSANLAEECYDSLSKDLNHKLSKRIPVIVYGSHGQFEQTNIMMEAIPEGVGGFTEMYKNRVVVPFTGSYSEYKHVLYHELTHAVVFDLIFGNFSTMLMRTRFNIPLWFHEGLSEYESLKWDINSDAYLMDAIISGNIPTFSGNFGGFTVYKAGQSFYNYLASVYGKESIQRFLHNVHIEKEFPKAFESSFGEKLEEVDKQWRKFVKKRYWPELGKRMEITDIAKQLTFNKKDFSNFNLQPSLSPNGNEIAFFSDRKGFTDIYIASTKKMKVITKIASQKQRVHVESLHPFYSGITWSPDGTKILYTAKVQGKENFIIYDIKKNKEHGKIPLNFKSAFSPDWSPDGRFIVFSGVKDSSTDIYSLELSTKKTKQLTYGYECERNPRFSPDGTKITFDSNPKKDNFLKNVSVKINRNIFVMKSDGTNIRRLTKSTFCDEHPAWATNGKSIFFTSNRNGIKNLYSIRLDSNNIVLPISDIVGSCQTPNTAKSSNKLVFSYYTTGAWNLYCIDNPSQKTLNKKLEPTFYVKSLQDTSIKFFPALKVTNNDSVSFKKDSLQNKKAPKTKRKSFDNFTHIRNPFDTRPAFFSNLPTDTTYPTKKAIPDSLIFFYDSLAYKTKDGEYKTHPYKLKFSPDVALFGITASTYYGAAAQGAVVFSDIMGNHRISVSGDFYQNTNGTSNLLFNYFCLKNRTDWGFTGFFSRNFTGNLSFSDSDSAIYFYDQYFGGALITQYPFSMVSRTELSLLGISIERKGFIDTLGQFMEFSGNSLITKNTVILQSAFVHDNILWGFTGPVNGNRWRIDVSLSPALMDYNDFSFLTVGADIRKYFNLWKKYSFALRLSTGFSQAIANGENPVKFKLGGDNNWLFSPSVKVDNTSGAIDDTYFSNSIAPLRGTIYNEYSGTKYLLHNFEFRYPFIRNIDIVWPIPIRLRYIKGALFYDIGSAWDNTKKWHPFTTSNGWIKLDDLVAGIGVGMRMNLGIAVIRLDRAWKTNLENISSSTTYLSLGAEL